MNKVIFAALLSFSFRLSAEEVQKVEVKKKKDGSAVYNFNFYQNPKLGDDSIADQKVEEKVKQVLKAQAVEASSPKKKMGYEVLGMTRTVKDSSYQNFVESIKFLGVGLTRWLNVEHSRQMSFGFAYSTLDSSLVYPTFRFDSETREYSGNTLGIYGKYSQFFDIFSYTSLSLSTILDVQYGDLENILDKDESYDVGSACASAEAIFSLKFSDGRVGVGGNIGYCRFMTRGNIESLDYDIDFNSVVSGVSVKFNFGV